MKKKYLRTAVTVLLALLLVVGIGGVIRQQMDYRDSERERLEAEEIAGVVLPTPTMAVEEPAPTEEVEEQDPYGALLREIDLAALQEINADVMGWIAIPDSDLSYPVVLGENNDYYLNRTWQKNYNSGGAIFMDYRNSRDLSDFHTIIYGHRMNNGSMFGLLHQYKQEGYFEAHPYVYIADANGSHKYEIFSIYVADSLNTYQLDFTDDEARQSFIDYCMEKSDVDTGVIPTIEDRIITLSTCTGNGHATRWVVQAVLRSGAS